MDQGFEGPLVCRYYIRTEQNGHGVIWKWGRIQTPKTQN